MPQSPDSTAPSPAGITFSLVISEGALANVASILKSSNEAEVARVEGRERLERCLIQEERARAERAQEWASEARASERAQEREERAEHRLRANAESLTAHLLEEKKLGRDIALELLKVGVEIIKQKLAEGVAAKGGAAATPDREEEEGEEEEYETPADPFSNPWDFAPDVCNEESPPGEEEEPTAGKPEVP